MQGIGEEHDELIIVPTSSVDLTSLSTQIPVSRSDATCEIRDAPRVPNAPVIQELGGLGLVLDGQRGLNMVSASFKSSVVNFNCDK